MLLLRSSSDSLPTCSIPMSSYRRPCASTSLLTTVSAIVTTSSSSSHVAKLTHQQPLRVLANAAVRALELGGGYAQARRVHLERVDARVA